MSTRKPIHRLERGPIVAAGVDQNGDPYYQESTPWFYPSPKPTFPNGVVTPGDRATGRAGAATMPIPLWRSSDSCRYEYAKRQVKMMRITVATMRRRAAKAAPIPTEPEDPSGGISAVADAAEPDIPLFWGAGLVRYVFDAGMTDRQRARFPWPIPEAGPGHDLVFEVTPSVEQVDKGCLCLSTRCGDPVRCNPENVRTFSKIPIRRSGTPLRLYDATGRLVNTARVVSEDSGPRRRIAMLTVRVGG